MGAKNTQIKNSKSSLLEYKSKCRLSDLMNYILWLASLRDKRFAISAFVRCSLLTRLENEFSKTIKKRHIAFDNTLLYVLDIVKVTLNLFFCILSNIKHINNRKSYFAIDGKSIYNCILYPRL